MGVFHYQHMKTHLYPVEVELNLAQAWAVLMHFCHRSLATIFFNLSFLFKLDCLSNTRSNTNWFSNFRLLSLGGRESNSSFAIACKWKLMICKNNNYFHENEECLEITFISYETKPKLTLSPSIQGWYNAAAACIRFDWSNINILAMKSFASLVISSNSSSSNE